MTVLLAALGLFAVVALTLGTAIAVASEFSLTALERSRVDRHAATVGDRRARAVARAHRNLSFQLSGCQLAITITTLVTGYIAEPAVASFIRPALTAVGVPERFVERHYRSSGKPFRRCQPRDVISHAIDYIHFDRLPFELTDDLLDQAFESCFTEDIES